MPQMISGDIICKSFMEFDVRFLHGTPYCIIVKRSDKNRLYKLDTKDNLYSPIAEWGDDDRDGFREWHAYLVEIDRRIMAKREELGANNPNNIPRDKVEQLVPDAEKLFKRIEDDEWSYPHR